MMNRTTQAQNFPNDRERSDRDFFPCICFTLLGAAALLGLLSVPAYYGVYVPFRHFSTSVHRRLRWNGDKVAIVERVREDPRERTFSFQTDTGGYRTVYPTTATFTVPNPRAFSTTPILCSFTEDYDERLAIGTQIPFLYNPQDLCVSESKAQNSATIQLYGIICGVEVLLLALTLVIVTTLCREKRRDEAESDTVDEDTVLPVVVTAAPSSSKNHDKLREKEEGGLKLTLEEATLSRDDI